MSKDVFLEHDMSCQYWTVPDVQVPAGASDCVVARAGRARRLHFKFPGPSILIFRPTCPNKRIAICANFYAFVWCEVPIVVPAVKDRRPNSAPKF